MAVQHYWSLQKVQTLNAIVHLAVPHIMKLQTGVAYSKRRVSKSWKVLLFMVCHILLFLCSGTLCMELHPLVIRKKKVVNFV